MPLHHRLHWHIFPTFQLFCLFDPAVHKHLLSADKLQYIKEFSKKIEETLYINLFSGEDKGAKYLQRAKSIVFNLGVSLFANIIKERN